MGGLTGFARRFRASHGERRVVGPVRTMPPLGVYQRPGGAWFDGPRRERRALELSDRRVARRARRAAVRAANTREDTP